MARPRLSDDNLSEDERLRRELRRAYDARRRLEGPYFVDEAVREYIERANTNDAIALWPNKGPGLW